MSGISSYSFGEKAQPLSWRDLQQMVYISFHYTSGFFLIIFCRSLGAGWVLLSIRTFALQNESKDLDKK